MALTTCALCCSKSYPIGGLGPLVRLAGLETHMSAVPDQSCPRASARFTDRVVVRCPASLPSAIDRAAAKSLMTSSEYIRRSVIDRLKADGIDLAQATD
jgi:hypothetical protein